MSPVVFLILASSIFVPCHTQSQQPVNSEGEAFLSIRLSEQGLHFLKSTLVRKTLNSITPLILPKIEETVKIPVLGEAGIILSHISITQISDYSCGCNKTGDSVIAWGEVCNLTINLYSPFFNPGAPKRFVDNGCAAIQVDGMQLGHTLDLQIYNGKLKLSLRDYSYNDKDISVQLKEGSWLFQGMIEAFQRNIALAVQKAISNKFKEQIDSFGQALPLPNEIAIDENSSVNVTLIKVVSFDNSYVFDINGLFISKDTTPVLTTNFRNSQPFVFCTQKSKQIVISVDEHVLNSASALYYDAKFMQRIMDELPDSNLINTSGWSSIVPQLQKQYPNFDLKLNISLSTPPIIRISEHKIVGIVYASLIIHVLKADQVIPVACFSLKMNGSGTVGIIEDEFPGILRIGGSVKLNDLSVSLEWSNIGNLRLHLIQRMMQSYVETVLLPYANAELRQGFSMPGIHGFVLHNAEIILSNSKINLCGDLVYVELQ